MSVRPDSGVPTTAVSSVTATGHMNQSNAISPGAPTALAFENLETEYPSELSEMDTERFQDSGVNGWFPVLENYVQSIAEECSLFSTKHADSSKTYNNYYQAVTLGLIMLPLLSGLITLLPLPETALRIATGMFNLIQAAIAGLNKTMQFSEQAYVHRKASDKYSDLHSSVAEQLLFPCEVRNNGIKFARWGRIQFFKLRAMTPFPDKKKTGRKHDIENPPMKATHLQEVVVDAETGALTGEESSPANDTKDNYRAFYARPNPVLFKSTH